MQDKYVGDVGDFGKYGLLNEICKKSNGSFRLGINWFYVTKEDNRPDGRYTKYLDNNYKKSDKYHICFPELYSKLKRIVDDKKRSIEEIEKNGILPSETIFYSKPLPYDSINLDRKREIWFIESQEKLKNADIIFLDPDNGVQSDKVKKTHINSIKYVFVDEIIKYYKQKKSLVIYNHRNRKPKSEYNPKIISLRDCVDAVGDVKVLRFMRFSVRDFIFLIQKEHQNIINQTIDNLTKNNFKFLYEKQYLMD